MNLTFTCIMYRIYIHSIQCTLYVQCIMDYVEYMYNVCTVYTVHIMYIVNVHCTIYYVHNMYSVHSTYYVYCTMYTVQYTMYSICTLYNVLCSVYAHYIYTISAAIQLNDSSVKLLILISIKSIEKLKMLLL